ncbi:MAG: hypothetical protein KAZ71_03525 [Bacteroidia bacterium]|nr:hypothetical protein [Bacteroidia bacterium]
MKNLIMILFASVLVFGGCKKKDKSTTIVVKVPKFELIGPTAFSTPAGPGSYVDPGVTYTDEEGKVSVLTEPTSSDVNLAAPGFYSCTYEKKTEHGYKLKASRLVLVTPVSPLDDHGGIYSRSSAAGTQTVTITKIGTGLYTTDNVGGVYDNDDYEFEVFFGLVNDSTIVMPSQPNVYGGGYLFGVDGKLKVNGATTTIQYKIFGDSDIGSATGFGTSLRTFIK